MAKDKEIRVIPLVCKSCGNALNGAEEDVVFYCPQCAKGWEFHDNSLAECAVYYVKPSRDISEFSQYKVYYLPFWVFELDDVEIICHENRDKEVFIRKMKQVPRIYVEAYESFMGDIYGNLAMRYLMKNPDYELVKAEKVVGCTRLSHHIVPYLKYYLLRYLDQFRDVTNLELKITTGRHYLACFPYVQVNSELLDLTIDVKICIQGIMNFHVFDRTF